MTGARVRPFRVRWLGKVRYRDALALQHGVHAHAVDLPAPQDHLLLLEHHAVYTLGVSADPGNLLEPAEEIGADYESVQHVADQPNSWKAFSFMRKIQTVLVG